MIFRTATALLLITSLAAECRAQDEPGEAEGRDAFRLDWYGVQEARAQEQARGAVEVEPEGFYMMRSPYELAPAPVIFRRLPERFEPAPTVMYFYSLPDSTIRAAMYEWDRNASADTETAVLEPIEQLEAYDAQYDELKAELVRKLGEPEEERGLKEQRGFGGGYWSRSDVWKTDRYEVVMELAFSGERGKEVGPNVRSVPTHRIRVSVLWLSEAG